MDAPKLTLRYFTKCDHAIFTFITINLFRFFSLFSLFCLSSVLSTWLSLFGVCVQFSLLFFSRQKKWHEKRKFYDNENSIRFSTIFVAFHSVCVVSFVFIPLLHQKLTTFILFIFLLSCVGCFSLSVSMPVRRATCSLVWFEVFLPSSRSINSLDSICQFMFLREADFRQSERDLSVFIRSPLGLRVFACACAFHHLKIAYLVDAQSTSRNISYFCCFRLALNSPRLPLLHKNRSLGQIICTTIIVHYFMLFFFFASFSFCSFCFVSRTLNHWTSMMITESKYKDKVNIVVASMNRRLSIEKRKKTNPHNCWSLLLCVNGREECVIRRMRKAKLAKNIKNEKYDNVLIIFNKQIDK